jgi:predicted lipid-binding transport protein (Tim44 family)
MISRPLIAFGAIAAAILLIIGDLEARPSGGASFGSRGSRTFSAPPATRTAPNTAAPIQRSVTQPSRQATTAAPSQPAGGGFLNRPGLIGGMLAGFLGAGLLGMVLGHGLAGGLGGLASVLGLMAQLALVAGGAWLIWSWWQRKQALAVAGGPAARNIVPNLHAYSGNGSSVAATSFDAKVRIANGDYDAFERLLSEISLAYGAEDRSRLAAAVTPEMLGYFSEQLDENASRGVANEISAVKLLQGDLAEAWREGDTEYATVAMRYAITERAVERASGRVVEGSDAPQEVTELWTFARANGNGWLLSAIQQAQ